MEYCSPISIQFVWHPNDKEIVNPIIDYCKANLSRDVNKPFLHSLDFPIFCFSASCKNDLPSSINTMSKKIILFVFIGDSIVSSDEWKNYLHVQISIQNVIFIPIAISNNAFKLDDIKNINSLRYLEFKNKFNNSKELNQYFFIAIAHEIYRWILSNDDEHKQLKLFLSHTKNDKNGLELARNIKAFIDSDTTLDNFFDTNDIKIGNNFNEIIKKNIEESTLIIIHSDNYSSRYWCQKEIIHAKNTGRPIISVDIIEKWEDRSFPLMCNYPNIRFNDSLLDILELALLETIRYYYCKELMNTYKSYGYISDESEIFNCVPDSFAVNNSNKDIIIYPEPELYPEEKEVISNGKMLKTPLSFSLVDVSEKRIGLSISEISEEELVVLGQDQLYLKKLSQILARKFLNCGSILIYGGDLRDDGFTRYLFDEALIIQDRIQRTDILIKDYIAWPIYLISEKNIENWIASYNGVCKIEKVSKPSDIQFITDDESPVLPDSKANCYVWSKSLTYMREKMISDCDIRICAGGKSLGYKGCMPGVLEEIKISLEYKKPLFLIGGLGGITGKVCKFIMTGEISEELTQCWQIANNEKYNDLVREYESHKTAIDYSWIERISIDSLNNGLTMEENLKLFTTPFADEIIYLISKGIRNMFPNTK